MYYKSEIMGFTTSTNIACYLQQGIILTVLLAYKWKDESSHMHVDLFKSLNIVYNSFLYKITATTTHIYAGAMFAEPNENACREELFFHLVQHKKLQQRLKA